MAPSASSGRWRATTCTRAQWQAPSSAEACASHLYPAEQASPQSWPPHQANLASHGRRRDAHGLHRAAAAPLLGPQLRREVLRVRAPLWVPDQSAALSGRGAHAQKSRGGGIPGRVLRPCAVVPRVNRGFPLCYSRCFSPRDLEELSSSRDRGGGVSVIARTTLELADVVSEKRRNKWFCGTNRMIAR